MRRSWLAAAPLTLILLSLAPLPAAAAHTSLECTSVLDLAISPGLSMMPSKGNFTTVGNSGPLECTGIFQGHEVTGPGSLGIQGNYGQSTTAGDTCQLEAGTGEYSLTLPTRGGTIGESGSLAEILGPGRQGSVGLASEQTSWAGSFDFAPTQGDCLSTPITAAQVSLRLEGRHGSNEESSIFEFEPPGGAVAEAPGREEPQPAEVTERRFRVGASKPVDSEDERVTATVGDEDVAALRERQLEDVAAVADSASPSDQAFEPIRLGDADLPTARAAIANVVSPPIWALLGRIGAAARMVIEKSAP